MAIATVVQVRSRSGISQVARSSARDHLRPLSKLTTDSLVCRLTNRAGVLNARCAKLKIVAATATMRMEIEIALVWAQYPTTAGKAPQLIANPMSVWTIGHSKA